MHHLTREQLARLLDEGARPGEAEHLNGCSVCGAELAAMERLAAALAGLPDLPPPADLRDRLERELEEAGLLRIDRWPAARSLLLRIAAGFALFLAGAGAGTFGIAPVIASSASQDGVHPLGLDDPVAAATTLAAAEADYLGALSRFAELTNGGEELDPFSRLAALDGIVITTGAALDRAPADPLINNYHLTALAQRDALLRQIEQLAANERWF